MIQLLLSLRRLRPAAATLVTLASASCTAILTPRDDVARCDRAEDCPRTGDNRYFAECRFADDSDADGLEYEQICIAAYRPDIRCDPNGRESDHPLRETFERYSQSGRYGCSDDELGSRGCRARPGEGCDDGLEPRESDNFCDVPGGESGAGRPVNIAGDLDLAGQDVLDQFCRSFFCDETFTCDRVTSTCVPCSANADFGQGGCGTVFIGGAPSCVYSEDLRGVCDGPQASEDDPKFGSCPEPAEG